MRLSDVLSKPPTLQFKQVEGFLDSKLLVVGKQKKIQVGKIALNYYCRNCENVRTFYSGNDIYCIGVNEHLVSIDCVLSCVCEALVQVWFLVDCDGDISGHAPEIRILKRSEKLSSNVMLDEGRYGEFSELMEKARRAHRDGLGAGAMIYLRKIYEIITFQTAQMAGINCFNGNGKKKSFKALLEEVDRKCSIIPGEFSENSYRLFGEFSDIIHGEDNEEIALKKYTSLDRLIVGIMDNVRNNSELANAVCSLEWNELSGGGSNEKTE